MSYNKETGMYEGYIYKIVNDVNDKIYIGQTRRTLNIRWSQHKNGIYNKNTYNNTLYKAMRKYGENKFSIEEICKIYNKDKDKLIKELDELEKYYIKQYNCLTPYGYNLTKGGEHVSINKESKIDAYYINGILYKEFNSMAEATDDIKSSKNYKNVSASSICKCCKGKLKSAYGFIWRYHNDDFNKYQITSPRDIEHTKKIKKYLLDGTYIKTYNSISEVMKELKIKSASPISKCCSGKAFIAYGYVWRYIDDDFDKYSMPIDQYTTDGILISSYNSIFEIISEIKELNPAFIISCCVGKYKQYKGYVWRYHNDNFNKD